MTEHVMENITWITQKEKCIILWWIRSVIEYAQIAALKWKKHNDALNVRYNGTVRHNAKEHIGKNIKNFVKKWDKGCFFFIIIII